jgi:non-specific serine/threonine protein kinase/serine/threonine-protein kinase
MTPERWLEIKRIFDGAADLAPVERERFLDSACGNGAMEMRREVEGMLAADAAQPLAESPISFLTTHNDFTYLNDKRLGRYRIVREVGRGGMGTVYAAVRDDGEFEQKVAIKIIRRGLNTDEIVRRFRHERQILASLQHSNIARLLDGGMSEEGLPFFVMEFIEGVPLDEYCEANDLNIHQRLELFRQVCSALSYAHGRLIVHRDLKPANILVTSGGEVSLLDFGIAKVVAAGENGSLQNTATQLGLMTPDYASPEQFRGEPVTTATDVYSLGVVLYELLTGVLPYDLNGLRLDQMLERVCETEPSRPSLSIAEDGWQTPDSIHHAPNRYSAIRIQQLKGDLDNIVLKALRKEPEQRYASVEQFSEDIRRHLSGLPVSARPATFGYRARKFAGRNRIAVSLSILILLTLLVGIAATGWQAVRAERERKLAQKRFELSRDLANSLIFKYHDAIANLPNSSPVREMLLKDASAYLDELAQDARGDLTLRREVASAYMKLGDIQGRPHRESLGNTSAAIENYEKATALFEALAQNSPASDRPRANHDLLTIYQKLRTTLARAREQPERRDELRSKRIAILEEMLKGQPDDIGMRMDLADAHQSASNRLFRANFEAGDRYYQQHILPILADAERIAPTDPATLELRKSIYSDLGWYFGEQGRLLVELEQGDDARMYFERALEFFRQAAKVYEAQYRSGPTTMKSRRQLKIGVCIVGIALGDAGRVDESYGYLKDCLNFNQELARFDPNNLQAVFDIGDSYNSLGVYHRRRRDYVQAFSHFRQSLSHMERVIAADGKHHEAINYKLELLTQLGNTHAESGELNQSLTYYEQAKAFGEKYLTGEPDDRVQLGRVYLNAGRTYIKFAERETSSIRAPDLWIKARTELQRAAEIVASAPAQESRNQLRLINNQLSKCDQALDPPA